MPERDLETKVRDLQKQVEEHQRQIETVKIGWAIFRWIGWLVLTIFGAWGIWAQVK